MKSICPNPIPWSRAFERLTEYSRLHQCIPPSPPTPLILAGWAYSNDVEKLRRSEETVAWGVTNGCAELVAGIPDQEFLFVDAPTDYAVGPLGGPMYRAWDLEKKERPRSQQLAQRLETLRRDWSQIAGQELAKFMRPLNFAGEKARRLVVFADRVGKPPWGEWSHLSANEADRRSFTRLRAAINQAIAPHEVDHIDFTTELPAAPRSG
jgi:hypothetical protein